MSRTNQIIKNTFLFAIASFGPKFLSFFLVPLYTACLSTEAYGTADLLSTIVSLLLPILMVDISDAILIYTVERRKSGAEINIPISYGMYILKLSTAILFAVLFFVTLISRNISVAIYCVYILLRYFALALHHNILAYLRGTDRVPLIVSMGLVNTIATISCNIIFILWLQCGVYGLLLSSVLGTSISCVYAIVRGKLGKILLLRLKVTSKEKEEMLKYSIPLIFTGLAWWVNGYSDRFFVTLLVGISANGIYAVASKLPQILNACHSVIYQVLQLSVYSEIDAGDRNVFLRRLYDIYNFCMICVCAGLILLNKVLSAILFKNEFYIAWKYVPGLLIGTVVYSVSGYMTTIIAANKKTKTIAAATCIGAGMNTLLNICLIGRFQIYGAVVATMIGYFLIWFVSVYKTQREMGINFHIFKSVLLYGLLIIQWIVQVMTERYVIIHLIICGIICALNYRTIFEICRIVVSLLKKQFGKK